MVDAVDVARGDVSRTRWIERAIERALEEPSGSSNPRRASEGESLTKVAVSEPAPVVPRAPVRAVGWEEEARLEADQPAKPSEQQLANQNGVPRSKAREWLVSGEWEKHWNG